MEQRSTWKRGQSGFADARLESLDDNYDEVWPRRMPGSARRYQGLADVRTERVGPREDGELFSSERGSRAGGRERFDRRSVGREGIDRRSASSAQGPYAGDRDASIPARRTATQTNIPTVQPNRRNTVRGGEMDVRDTETLEVYGGGFRPHWLVVIGVAMLVMVMGWVVFSAAVNWWQVTQDDVHYGRPRTFQVDAVVGHNDSGANPSHFIAINLSRHIEIIEFPGGDPTKAKVYVGPTLIGDGQDLAAVTLSFKDVTADGRPDMVINIQDSHFVFVNDNGTFRPAHPGENVHL